MVSNIFSMDFYRSITEYALNYSDRRQCKVDFCCRVVYEKGDSMYDICRRSNNATEFKDTLINSVKVTHDMGVINDRILDMCMKYLKEWIAVMPSSKLGWCIMKKVMNLSEKRKKEWVKNKNK